MSLRPIVIAPDRRLKTVCRPVAEVDEDVRNLMADMLETMYDAPGIGLAAPQIGVDKRVIVVDVADKEAGEEKAPLLMANPEIESTTEALCTMSEGCLSLPDIYVDVERPEGVAIRYTDEDNQPRTLEADGLLARCILHEIDHLNGVLHVDYLSSLKRNMILRRLAKQKPSRRTR